MARAAARGAERALESKADKSGLFYESYGGYPIYLGEYNRLLQLTINQIGEEAAMLFQPIEFDEVANPNKVAGVQWRTYAELASVRLNALASYLQNKLGTSQKETEGILEIIDSNLRAALFEDPSREEEVQNALEIIFRARALDYRRSKVSIPYSSKSFVPDFTFDFLDLALEVKLCKTTDQEKTIIDEINADIPAYLTRYSRIIFVVYDLGCIRDVDLFRSGIEKNPNIRVLVVKK